MADERGGALDGVWTGPHQEHCGLSAVPATKKPDPAHERVGLHRAADRSAPIPRDQGSTPSDSNPHRGKAVPSQAHCQQHRQTAKLARQRKLNVSASAHRTSPSVGQTLRIRVIHPGITGPAHSASRRKTHLVLERALPQSEQIIIPGLNSAGSSNRCL